ncbi:MAG: response regulator, partial [Gammaproteobacteria bacterium]
MAGESILIVDDNLINLKLAKVLLVIEGYNVRVANSAEDALDLLTTFHPRLILMDLQLPGISGLELTRKLKSDSNYKDIVILAVTAYAMKGDKEKALAEGVDGYITKPIDTMILPNTISVRSKNLWVNSINILSYKLKELFTNRVVPSMI